MTLPFALLNLGHAATHFLLMVFPTAVIALEARSGASYGTLVGLATWSYVAIALLTLPIGWLGDRVSRRNLMIVCFLGLGASSIATGFATTPLAIGAGLFAIGLAASIYHPIGIALVAETASGKLGRAMGINGVCGNLGLAAAPLATAVLLAHADWQGAFMVPGAIVALLGLGYVLLVAPDGPRRAAEAAVGAIVPIPTKSLWRVGIVQAIATTTGGIVFTATTVSLPKLMTGFVDVATPESAGIAATVVLGVAGFAQIVVGTLLDRVPLRRLYIGLLLAEAAALGGVALASGMAGVVMAGVAMLLVFGLIPVGDTLVARVTPARWRSRVYAVVYQLSLGISVAAVPLIGWVHDGWGFGVLYLVLDAAAALEAFAALALPRGLDAPVR
jgi:MFS family permease